MPQPIARIKSCDTIEFVEFRPWTAFEDRRFIAITDRADEIALVLGIVGKKCLVDRIIVKPRHRPTIEPEGAGGDHQVGTL